MEQSRSNRGEWLFSKDEVLEAIENGEHRLLDANGVGDAIDAYLAEQLYTDRLLAGSLMIDEIDNRTRATREGFEPNPDRLRMVAGNYLAQAERSEYDDVRSQQFKVAARLILADENGERIEEVTAILENVRTSLVAEGFIFNNIEQGEGEDVPTN